MTPEEIRNMQLSEPKDVIGRELVAHVAEIKTLLQEHTSAERMLWRRILDVLDRFDRKLGG